MELKEYLEEVAENIDMALQRYFGGSAGELNKASSHLLLAGGKRLRPAVVILAANAIRKGSSQDVLPAALALEVTHTFTLIHDDIMDGDDFRRGVPTVHTVWDEPTGILAGDVLYAEAFELLCRAIGEEKAKINAVALLGHTCAEICQGQYMDMSFEKREDVDEAEYMDMVAKKTGVLYAAAAAIGGMLAGANDGQISSLYEWGVNSGVAFQIQDDLIDLLADPETSGKNRASDLKSGKQTIIAIKALEKGIDLSKYHKDSLTDDEIDDAISRLEKAGVLDEVRAMAQERVKKAKTMLSLLPESEERELLSQITDYFVSRGF